MTQSWDFWDTLVTRCVLNPTDVFVIVERISGVAGFAETRKAAEARSRQGVAETTLERIYNQLPYDDSTRRTLLAMELHVEEQMASPVVSNVERWRACDIIVSDMYLDRLSILRIAAKCGIEVAYSHLFLSSEFAATKATGELYNHVKLRFSIAEHIGDNLHSDVTLARRAGIKATHFSEPPPTTIERDWSRNKAPDACLIAGLLRAARLAEPHADDLRKGEWSLYSQAVAPLLLRFVDWTISHCEELGIDQLFFLARDGQILHRIACALISARGSPIRAHYAYASRQALHLPGHRSIAQSESWILDNTRFLSLQVIAERVGIDTSSLARIGARYLVAEADVNLTAPQRACLPSLIRDPEFIELVRVSADRALVDAVSYLHQIGLLDPTHKRVGIVDVGWAGRVQQSLEGISTKAGLMPDRIHGFYLGLAKRSVHASGERLHGMLADPFRPHVGGGSGWVNSYSAMFEFFLRANHPTTIGYCKDAAGCVNPVLGPDISANDRRDIEAKQDAIMSFVERYCRLETVVGNELVKALDMSENVLRRVLERPTREEAAVFSGHQHSEQQIERAFIPMVRPLALADVLVRRNSLRFGYWPEGSYALSGFPWLYRIRPTVAKVRTKLLRAITKR